MNYIIYFDSNLGRIDLIRMFYVGGSNLIYIVVYFYVI